MTSIAVRLNISLCKPNAAAMLPFDDGAVPLRPILGADVLVATVVRAMFGVVFFADWFRVLLAAQVDEQPWSSSGIVMACGLERSVPRPAPFESRPRARGAAAWHRPAGARSVSSTTRFLSMGWLSL